MISDDQSTPVFHHPKATRIGLISDTHVPDRVKILNPALFDIFKNVDLILHGGDISTQPVLDALNEIAPTIAVRGNNRGDRLFNPPLPEKCIVNVAAGLQIAMWHGMETPWHRLTDAFLGRAGFFNYVAKRMIKRCQQHLPKTDIVFFGHLHWPKLHMNDDRLFINAGRAFSKTDSSCAVMEIDDQTVRIKIHPLGRVRHTHEIITNWHVFCLNQKD